MIVMKESHQIIDGYRRNITETDCEKWQAFDFTNRWFILCGISSPFLSSCIRATMVTNYSVQHSNYSLASHYVLSRLLFPLKLYMTNCEKGF